MRALLTIFLLFLLHVTKPSPLKVISKTYDIQDIHLIHHDQVRHYKVATIRIAFDQNLLLSTTSTTTDTATNTNDASKNKRRSKGLKITSIEEASAELLYGLTRLQCDDHLIESCPTSNDDRSYHRGIGHGIPQFLYALTKNTITRSQQHKQNISVPFQTILRLTHDVEKPRANQYVAILVVKPRSTTFGDELEDDHNMNVHDLIHYEEDHALQRWNIDHLKSCTLEFLKPCDQISLNGTTVELFGDLSIRSFKNSSGGGSNVVKTKTKSVELFHNSITKLKRTKPPMLSVQQASAIIDDTINNIEKHETLPSFANDMKNILTFAEMYDHRQNELLHSIVDGDDNIDGSDQNKYDPPPTFGGGSGSDTTSILVNQHITNTATSFAHSGMIVALLEVVHRMSIMNTLKTSQYWELIEDGLTNMMIPNFVKMAVELTKSPILTMITDTLTPILTEIIICPILAVVYPQAECMPDGVGDTDPGAGSDPKEEPPEESKCTEKGGHAGECRKTTKPDGKRNCPVPFLHGYCPGGNE
jgi:hypothetical protein